MDLKDDRIIQSAFWLIRLRWIGVGGIVTVTYLSSSILNISIESVKLYLMSAIFLIMNGFYFFLLKGHLHKKNQSPLFIRRLLNVQILADLLVLTIMLHFSGGIENPFIIYYIFHMIIGSIVLSPKESFMQTTFALFLIGLLSLSEYLGLIPHYRLEGFVIQDLYKSEIYLISTGLIFVSTSYLVIYVTCSLAARARRNEEAYKTANIELRNKDSIKNEYVLRLTHDIKGHLGAIQGCLSCAANKIHEPGGKSLEEFIDRALNRTNILIKFVRDLLNLTKMKLDKKFQMKDFSIRESVKNVLENLQVQANESNIEIVTDIDERVNDVTGWKVSIEEVIANLVLNAIKYSERNSIVHLSIREFIDHVLVEIKDHGIGIPENEKKEIFNEFTRASNAKKANIRGTGMGLSIVRQIVHNHGGEIWVESQEGTGSTFCFTIPK